MNQISKTSHNESSEIDLNLLVSFFWKNKIIFCLIITTFTIISLIYSLSLSNFYTSQSLLAPTEKEDSLSSKLGSYSSLTGLAGVNLLNENSSNATEAIERIKSFEFFSKYLLPNIKLENIMAIKDWDLITNTLIYDKKLYDEESGEWTRKFSHTQSRVPSQQETFKIFLNSLNISVDKDTSFVTIKVRHQSPYVAKKWLEIIIFNINESMRSQDIRSSEASIDFLNKTQKLTKIQSIKDAISSLQETQMQTLMLASSNEAYVFKVIDSPIAPETKSSPNRFFICILGGMFGFFFSIFIILFRNLKNTSTL